MVKHIGRGVIFFLLIIGSCSGPPPAKPAVPAGPAAPVVVKEGVLTYVAGDVSVKTGDTWVLVDVGEKVLESSAIKTGKNSSCDLQFGQLGVLHIAESSLVSLKTVGLSSSKKAVDLELVSGAVTAKVSKLLQDQRFQVRTNTVVCGVRGTRFMVSQRGEEKTSIAVAEGSVALVPPTYDPKVMEASSKTPEQAAMVQEVMKKILESSPTVTVGKEVEVTHAEMAKSSVAVSQIQEAVAAVMAAPTPPPPVAPEPVAPTTTTATPATPSAPAAAPPPTPIPNSLTVALAKVLDSYQKAPPAAEAPKIKAMSVATQEAMKQTVELKIIETPPEKPAAPVAPPPPPALKAPKAVFPEAGSRIDIHTVSSIAFSWKAAVGATSYEVSLSLLNGDQKTVVKTWTTTNLSVLLDKFDKLQAGTFVWEVIALRDNPGAAADRSPPNPVTFQIVQQGQLSAPVLDLSGGN